MRLLNFTIQSEALMGSYADIHYYNKDHTEHYNHRVLSFVRWSADEKLVVVSNFDTHQKFEFDLKLPKEIMQKWNLNDGNYILKDVLSNQEFSLAVSSGIGHVQVALDTLQSYILKLN